MPYPPMKITISEEQHMNFSTERLQPVLKSMKRVQPIYWLKKPVDVVYSQPLCCVWKRRWQSSIPMLILELIINSLYALHNADAALISVLNVGGSSSRDIPHFVVEYYKVRDRARGGSMCLNHPELMWQNSTHLPLSNIMRFEGVRWGSMCLNHPELMWKNSTRSSSWQNLEITSLCVSTHSKGLLIVV